MKRLSTVFLLLTIIGLSACSKNNNGGCGTQMCSTEFATIVFQFTDKNGTPTAVTDVKLINIRTNKAVKIPPPNPYANTVAGFVALADDSTKSEFSAGGDEVRVSAKSVETGKMASATLKISGGCNCHVSKVSGPDKVAFN
ncbi:MAG: hypothetical protein JKY70_08915 [Mucilaginibacter sp.]|nr:hypothetical protein [Mucilaginibacter sp.]